jgi:hypothetical protein
MCTGSRVGARRERCTAIIHHDVPPFQLHFVGRVILASPFVASAYEDRTLYFRHNRGKWHVRDGRHVPWVSGETAEGTVDVNEENRTRSAQECSN